MGTTLGGPLVFDQTRRRRPTSSAECSIGGPTTVRPSASWTQDAGRADRAKGESRVMRRGGGGQPAGSSSGQVASISAMMSSRASGPSTNQSIIPAQIAPECRLDRAVRIGRRERLVAAAVTGEALMKPHERFRATSSGADRRTSGSIKRGPHPASRRRPLPGVHYVRTMRPGRARAADSDTYHRRVGTLCSRDRSEHRPSLLPQAALDRHF
jgi:hypothetical protein